MREKFRHLIDIGLCLFCFFLPLSISAANLGWGLLFIGVAGVCFVSRQFPSLRSPLEKPLSLYLAVSFLAALFGESPPISFQRFHSEISKVWLFYLFSAAFTLSPNPPLHRWLGLGFLISAGVGILQVLSLHAPGTIAHALQEAGRYRFCSFLIPSFRAHGTLHSVTYGESISLGLTGGLAYLSWSSFTKSPATPRTLNVFCLILLAALGLSQTRGAWLGFTASLLVLVWLRRNLLPFVLKSGAILTLILAFLSRSTGLHLFNRFVSIFHPQGDPNIGRLELWKTAWNMFKDHPWLGVGLNNYRTLFSRYHPTPIYGEEVWGSAHNLYLHQLAERGILGLLALLLLLGSMVYYSIKRYRKNPSPLNTWNLAALVGFLIMNLTETSFETTMSWMPIIFLYAWSEKTDATSAGWGQEAQGKKED